MRSDRSGVEVLGAAGAASEMQKLGHLKRTVPERNAGNGADRRCGSGRVAEDPRAVKITQ
ncbi:hypothetical protein [Nostoc sp. 'Lobaria pulmonaria (5183) cyanobiont']|uniref:hypothetical protein n=1 Tax=Nostoc sp. 'Lobaria pulmonaria (5183) cyanobiont' TaxID=1618022 RepID=UPI001F38A4C0|nr:hypothetical protein [Nostoc sp. 'Lobaria pulmonaria (5183) cyanobiont']